MTASETPANEAPTGPGLDQDGDAPSTRLRITTPNDLEILMTREFNAPRPMMWEALTRPELLRRWYGPRGYRLTECEIDLRVGGLWRFVVQAPDGSEMELQGAYREICHPERLVQTETNNDCDAAGGIQGLTTTQLLEKSGRTELRSRSRFSSQAARDAVLNSGMEYGLGQAYEKLAEILIDVRAGGSVMATAGTSSPAAPQTM